MDEAADALVGVGYCAAIEEAAEAEGFGEDGGEAFDFAGGGGRGLLQRAMEFGGGFCVADQFVEADCYGLAEIHRAMLRAGGDAQQPVAVAEIFVGQAGFFRAEEERDAICFSAAGIRRERGAGCFVAPRDLAFKLFLREIFAGEFRVRWLLTRERLENDAGASLQRAQLMMQLAAAGGRRADY